MKFFFDNNISIFLAKGMNAFQESVTHLQDHLPEDTDDISMLNFLGKNGWILVTRDRNIHRNPAELKAFLDNKVGAFVLTGNHMNKCEIINQIIRSWPKIKQEAKKGKKPFAFKVRKNGGKLDRIALT